MARLYACRNLCQNLLPTSEDELAGVASKATINENGIPTHTFAILYALTSTPAAPLAPINFVNGKPNANNSTRLIGGGCSA